MIAREQRVLLRQGEGEVVGGVAGGLDGREAPSRPGDGIAVVHQLFRRIAGVGGSIEDALLARAEQPRGAVRPAADDPGAGRRLEQRHRRGMVAMCVGDDDMAHRLTADGGEQSLDMGGIVRARIDDRHGAAPDDISAGAGEGHRTAIAGDDAADQRRERRDLAGRCRRGPVEFDLVGHLRLVTSLRRFRETGCPFVQGPSACEGMRHSL